MRILVAEDDPKLSSSIRRVLGEAGHMADVCADGTAALSQLNATDYSLAVVGRELPGIDGLELCRRLRSRGRPVAVFMTSTSDNVQDRVLALNTGADDFLVKPYHLAELVARAQAVLRRSSAQLSLTVGVLEIDLLRHTVKLAGGPLSLTAREFSLVLHLAQRVDALVTRSDLLNEVWSNQFECESNIVDVQVSRLRTKLGEHAWMVETLRGRGYRMRAKRDAKNGFTASTQGAR
jgi:two-component system OmpR family response regulator